MRETSYVFTKKIVFCNNGMPLTTDSACSEKSNSFRVLVYMIKF